MKHCVYCRGKGYFLTTDRHGIETQNECSCAERKPVPSAKEISDPYIRGQATAWRQAAELVQEKNQHLWGDRIGFIAFCEKKAGELEGLK